MIRYSAFYRLEERDTFFEKFFKKESKKLSADIVNIVRDTYYETLEMIAEAVLDNDKDTLKLLLTKRNAKVARKFFDYLTCSKIVNASRANICNRIDEVFME